MPQTQRHLSLFFPAQLHQALTSTPKSRTTALRTLLARGQMSVCVTGHERLMFDLFTADYDKTLPPPVAAVTHICDAGSTDMGWWLRADPVSLRPDGDCLLMLGQQALSVSADEAANLCAELQDVFAARGFEFSAPHPKHWYLRLTQNPCVTLAALDDVVGHNIMHHLPQAQDMRTAALWRSLLNEVQMQLHNSPVNRQRTERGKLPINSVWFWGGGPLPDVASQRFTQVWSHEPLSIGLARLSGAASATVPVRGTEWLQMAAQAGTHLVVIEPADATNATQCIENFSTDWCAPLLNALKSGAIDTLDLYTEDGKVFHNTRRTLRHWLYRFL